MTGWRAIAAVILLAGCQTHSWPGTDTASTPVFDGHSDFAVHYARSRPAWSATALNLSDRLPGQADVPRWRAGGVYGMLVTIGSDLGPGGQLILDLTHTVVAEGTKRQKKKPASTRQGA